MVAQRRGRWPWVVGVAGLTLAALHGAVWWAATGRIIAGLPDAVTAAAAAGWRVQGDAPERTGWPWTAGVRVGRFAATRLLNGEPQRWTADGAVLTWSPLDPARLRMDLTGTQIVTVGHTDIPVHARQAAVFVPLRGGAAVIDVRDLEAGPVAGSELAVRVSGLDGTVAGLGVSFVAEGVVLRPPLPAPFDGAATIGGRITTTVAFPDAETGRQAAATWQAAGGRLDAPEITVSSGPLQVSGRAEGGLDAALQPRGRAMLRVVGAATVLDAAARVGWLGPAPARAARAVLQLLTLGAGGGPVPLDVTLEERTATVAQFPLARLPVLEWDAP